MDAVLAVSDLRKVYQMGEVQVHALRGVSFSMAPGKLVMLLGPSGSGKSTRLNILGGALMSRHARREKTSLESPTLPHTPSLPRTRVISSA